MSLRLYYEHRGITIYHGDCRDVLPSLRAVSAVVSDPPYGLSFMGKGWDRSVPGAEFWTAVKAALSPGAHLMAFGGTRTYHRLTCAIEDAGFEIRDCLSWLYGSGFPKSLNLPGGLGTALKPAWEPIILARKLTQGTVAANVAAHGTAALNVDACRIGDDTSRGDRYNGKAPMGGDGITTKGASFDEPWEVKAGRWPSNVLLDEEAAAILDEQTGELGKGAWPAKGIGFGYNGGERKQNGERTETDSGGASRFFYVAKPSKRERGDFNDHPTVKPVALVRYLVRLIVPMNGTVADPFMGSGTTLIAAYREHRKAIGIEFEERYCEIAAKRLAQEVLPLEQPA